LRRLPARAGRALVRLAHPGVARVAFVATQWLVHFTTLYERAADNNGVHLLEHELFLATALVFWWPVLGSPSRLRGFWRVAYLGSAMQATMAVGVVLLTSDHVQYRHYPSLAGQHSAGALMWVLGSLLTVGFLLVVAWEWLQSEERRAVAREAYGR
jgi:putative copper resistance protein D